MSLLAATLRALIVPRRALPLGFLGVALLSAEWIVTRSAAAIGIDLLLFCAFCLLAPAAWRRLCSGEQRSVLRTFAAYLAYLFLCSAVVAALALAVPLLLQLPWTYVVEPASVGLLAVLFLVGGWGLGRDIDLEEGVAAARRRGDQLAVAAERAQLLALRAHLDPHFLFNTLNAIAEWCREDPRVAETATLHLAAMLRAMFDGIRQPTWKLATELELLRKMFALYRIRDEERYQLALEIADPLPDAELPPMLLFPIFENAITHGPGAGHAGSVVLRVCEQAGGLLIEMRNPGRFTGRRAGGEGISLVERRLALAYGGQARLHIAATEKETVTTVTLPLRPLVPEALP